MPTALGMGIASVDEVVRDWSPLELGSMIKVESAVRNFADRGNGGDQRARPCPDH
jgi:hypothetical protein